MPRLSNPTTNERSGHRSAARRWLLVAAVVWAAVIFATSCTWIDRDIFVGWVWRLLPSATAKQEFASFWDGGGGLVVVKGYHMAEFALLFLLARAVMLRAGMERRRAAWLAALIAVAFAASDEWHQTFVPGRGGTWVDVVIDTGGVSIAAFAVKMRSPRGEMKSQTIQGETVEAEPGCGH